ncbi:MAG: FecR family protein [Bacteroidetes bacterium]|nr:FecR family protein [Bacteroidota bacterium]
MLLISAALYLIPHLIPHKPKDFSVRLGRDFSHRSRPFATLIDGTKYTLNSNTELSHEGDTTAPVHELNLDGEGYFIVPKTPQPLLIHAPVLDVRTPGATLNINAYKGDKLIETSVFEGSAEVTLHTNPEQKLQLLAGYNTTLEELVPRLEREFDVKIFIPDDKLKTRRFTCVVEELDLPLTLTLLKQVQDFHFAINNKEVYIKP